MVQQLYLKPDINGMIVFFVHQFDMQKIIKLAMPIKYKNQFFETSKFKFSWIKKYVGGRHIIRQSVGEVINIHDNNKFSTKAAPP